MKRLLTLVIVLVVTACAGPSGAGIGAPLVVVQRATRPAVCETFTASDGAVIEYCPPAPATSTALPDTPVPSETATDTQSPPTDTHTPTPTDTEIPPPPTDTPAPPTGTPGAGIAPYPSAPLCVHGAHNDPLHDRETWHGVWNDQDGCHYDHNHGDNPNTPAVASTFPDMDLYALNGNRWIGHGNLSSSVENVLKHGGLKYTVQLTNPRNGCNGREGVPTGASAIVAQVHGFSDYSIEMNSRIHSSALMVLQCQPGNPDDTGQLFVNPHQDYGQRTSPYQGCILFFPDYNFTPYDSAREPYFTVDPIGGDPLCKQGRYPSRQFIINGNHDTNSTWIGEPVNIPDKTGARLGAPLFRVRDTQQVVVIDDGQYPHEFVNLCSSDGGATYDGTMPGCRWNNTTLRVQEVMGIVPPEWDNLAGFDSDPRVGRITGESLVSVAPDGDLQLLGFCQPGLTCFTVKYVEAFTGKWGTGITILGERESVFDPRNLPEQDVYFCDGVPCGEFDKGAVPSGWIGPAN